ncbi:PBP1A family penicillin-binding protein [Periweissella cryptocerci]|uniref:PBP1A family penicillin-binding protein n=1 Tax=Periweissella cryptocerci TaxID=2506420 RepID=A0A4P6YS47_9LACO|nr:PBP1A family penicillin-binding protein [Periweissella cryptocerci]QBO35433.1 PBP1A family penicillin-binding protein [Periweissella cryptocerci]
MSSNQPRSRVERNKDLYERNSKKPKQKGTKKKLKLWKKIVLGIIGLFVVVIVSGVIVFFSYASSAPTITEQKLASTNSTELFDDKGNVIWEMGTQKRDYASSKEIPDQLKESVVSIEDRRFYQHGGVDPRRIIGAAFANVTGSSLGLQGGSTLTQQLVKLSVFSTAKSDQTIKRKAQEAWLAMQVSKKFSKDQVLTFYINKVYMGEGVYGMKTASEYYYGKPLTKLSVDQFALLAGLPQSPSVYDPYINPEYAKERRNTVLAAMVANKKLTQAEATHYQAVPITHGLLKTGNKNVADAKANKTQKIVDAYAQSVISQLRKLGYKPETDGIKVYTNLNMKVQKRAYKVVNSSEFVNFPSNKFQVGLTMTDPKNGHVIAQIGGRKISTALGINRATQTNRSAGSTVKPLVDYGPAIEYLNWPTFRTIMDEKYVYPGTDTQVYDFENGYVGPMTMRDAIATSRNVPAVETLQTVGLTKSAQFLKRFGIKSQLYAASAIGIDLSSAQEAAAYGAFSNGGIYNDPQLINKIVTQDGKTTTFKDKSKRVMKATTAYLLTDMLKSVMTDSNGTGKDGRVPNTFEAGKTGTVGYDAKVGMPSGAVSDRWFTGYNQNYVLSVWTGYDQPNKPGNYIAPGYNSQIPLYIYKAIMEYAMTGKTSKDWKMPAGVTAVQRGGVRELELTGKTWSNGNLPNANSNGGTKQSTYVAPKKWSSKKYYTSYKSSYSSSAKADSKDSSSTAKESSEHSDKPAASSSKPAASSSKAPAQTDTDSSKSKDTTSKK